MNPFDQFLTINSVARSASARPSQRCCSTAPSALDFLLDGLALLITEGHEAGAPVLQQALSALREESVAGSPRLRWLWLASRFAMELWGDESWDVLSARQVELARQAGHSACCRWHYAVALASS